MTQDTPRTKHGVVLVGHGSVAKDCPRTLVTEFRALAARRRTTGTPPTPQEQELEQRIRTWPRTPQTDPYQAGLESLAAALRPLMNGAQLALAYLESCTPTLEEAVTHMVAKAVTDVLVAPSMLTPGGMHSESDIPRLLEQLRAQYPTVTLRYAWPFDMHHIARMLAAHLAQFS